MSSDWSATSYDFSASRYRRQAEAAQAEARRAQARLQDAERENREQQRNAERLVREIARGEARMDELDSTIADIQARRAVDQRRIEQNQRMIADLRTGVEEHSAELEAVNQQVAFLEQESEQARQRIEMNSHQISQLEQGVAQINEHLEQERLRLEQDHRSQMADVQAQTELAQMLRSSLDPARVSRFGYGSSYQKALTMLEHAEDSTRLGRLEAARATYQEAQREFVQVARDVDAREREYVRARSRAEASLRQLENELKHAGTDDMRFWHHGDYAALQNQVNALKQKIENGEFDHAGRPEQVITALEQLQQEISGRQIDVAQLEHQLVETVRRAQARLEIMQKMMSTLMDIWGDNQFAITYGYADKDDPKTALKVQTVRPNRPNVTMYMNLDGSFQFSWTGYPGMECAHDIDQFEQKLRSEHQLSLAVSSTTPKPGQPNPDLGPTGPGMTLIQMDQSGSVTNARQQG